MIKRSRIVIPIKRFNICNIGFGFIELPEKSAVQDAIFNLDGKFLEACDLKVAPSTVDPEMVLKSYAEKPQEYFQEIGRDFDFEDLLKPVREGRRIFVGGFDIRTADLKKKLIRLFRPFALDTMSEVKMNKQQKFVFVETNTREEADRFIVENHGKEQFGSTMHVQRIVLEDRKNRPRATGPWKSAKSLTPAEEEYVRRVMGLKRKR